MQPEERFVGRDGERPKVGLEIDAFFDDMSCSGLMYAGVPSVMPVFVELSFFVGSTFFAMPKSSTFTKTSRPDCVRKMLPGLMSR